MNAWILQKKLDEWMDITILQKKLDEWMNIAKE